VTGRQEQPIFTQRAFATLILEHAQRSEEALASINSNSE
jgi:hypothetical protein